MLGMRYPTRAPSRHPSSIGQWRGILRRTIYNPTPLLEVAPSTTTRHTTPYFSQPSQTNRVLPCASPFPIESTLFACALFPLSFQRATASIYASYPQTPSCIHRIVDRPWKCIPISKHLFLCPNFSTPYRRGHESNQVPLPLPFHS